MLVYDGTKTEFLRSVEKDTIAYEIEQNIYEKMNRHTARNEFRSWENSLEYMYKVLNDSEIPEDSGVAIEYNIPQTSKRVDFLISGYDKEENGNVVIIELKQWDKLEAVKSKDGLVETYTGNAIRQVVEAAELLEIFQWSAGDVVCEDKMDKIREELADVVNYCILMADTCGLDLDEIVCEKIKRNNEKYPVEKAFGSKEKYTELK